MCPPTRIGQANAYLLASCAAIAFHLFLPSPQPHPIDPRAYRPHLLEEGSTAFEKDWVKDLDLSRAASVLPADQSPPKILVLYGSLRSRSYSKLLAYEMARILDLMGADVSGWERIGKERRNKDMGQSHLTILHLTYLPFNLHPCVINHRYASTTPRACQ